MACLEIRIATPDGLVAAALALPANSRALKAGIIFYMDAFGLRPALYEMAERLASYGYAVLVPDLFYRNGSYGPFDAATAFQSEPTRSQIKQLMADTTQEMTIQDTASFLEVLKGHGASGPIATIGYCMGGARALNAAAVYSARIIAAASFHGGQLASTAPDSPYRKAGSIKARVYVGAAGVDPSFPPDQSSRLDEALRAGGVDYIIENYAGMDHGWTIADQTSFNKDGAERHWRRLETFLSETIGQPSR